MSESISRTSQHQERSAAQALRSQIEHVAPRLATVLIEGETGVGKEVTAREIHAHSLRSDKPFVPVDCTGFASELIESQLFGHVKGAFTGAERATLGLMRCADGGTLFLDEIGELPPPVQAKLLRCLQERTVVPLGGIEPVVIDVRIIAATHRDLARMVREGTFRQDLYFRINVVRLTIPPLRERPDDIIRLALQFIDELAQFYQEPNKRIAAHVQQLLLRYDWPGNVRELRNVMERSFVFCNDRTIDLAHLPSEVRECVDHSSRHSTAASEPITSLAEAERVLIGRVLKKVHGNQSQAAQLLDVERHRLRRLIMRHSLGHL
ncbi:MAG TPA: sigma 54-interacting transcriptional regulator, partial [Pirellulales bacterium]|nr:sigma 54-interacting transcriptional regulator [Pirellulales bacterium]